MFNPLRRDHPVASATGGDPTAPGGEGSPVNGVGPEVSPALEAAVRRAVQAAAAPLPPEMTTGQAAEFLDVSRSFILKLVKQGELPCRMEGKHRRIPTAALLEQREKMFQRAKKAMAEMSQIWQDMGLYEDESPPQRRKTT